MVNPYHTQEETPPTTRRLIIRCIHKLIQRRKQLRKAFEEKVRISCNTKDQKLVICYSNAYVKTYVNETILMYFVVSQKSKPRLEIPYYIWLLIVREYLKVVDEMFNNNNMDKKMIWI